MNVVYSQGGLKAAITADAIQGLTLMGVCICVVAQGAFETGSVEDLYTISRDNGKWRPSGLETKCEPKSSISF